MSSPIRTYLGLDMSLTSAGVAVIIVENRVPVLQTAYRIKTTSKERTGQRLYKIATRLRDTLQKYAPFDTIIREKPFVSIGRRMSTEQIMKSVGVSDLVLREYAIVEITATEIKKSIGGHGKADKAEVEVGVRKLLPLPEGYVFESDDASDASAVILTYLLDNDLIDVS